MKRQLASAIAVSALLLASCSTPTITPTETTTPPAKTTTSSRQQAILSAQSYVDGGAFSRKGLIAQLKFEKFSTEDATYAVDHIKADWNAEADESAKAYLDSGAGFSRASLIDQLKFDGFTQAQAEHGAKAVGL